MFLQQLLLEKQLLLKFLVLDRLALQFDDVSGVTVAVAVRAAASIGLLQKNEMLNPIID